MCFFYYYFAVDGMWGDWEEWSDCSLTCGDGTQMRERNCDNPARAFGGNDCMGEDEESQSCNKAACPTQAPDDVTPGPVASRSGSGEMPDHRYILLALHHLL